jgi:4-amino-4-deoxy-L-arabinose transferase-like glycosyltransferase
MLIPLLGLVLYAWVNGGKLDRRALRLPWLLVFVFVLGCPWFVYMVRVHPELKDFFLHRELQGRMTGHVDGRHGPVYFYILTSMVTWLPWWPVALVALVRGWKSVEGSGRAIFKKLGPEFFLVGTGLCVFSLVSSKLQTYTLTLAPWVALVFARILLWRPGLSLAGMVRLALLMWVVYGTGALVAPFYEASWGRNSSMRPVALFLSARGAEVVYADRYWPGLEFYGHEAIYYVGVRPPLEISADAGRVSQHFAPRPQRGENAWFVHFRKQSADVFRAWLEDPAVEKFQLGDFVVGRIP